MPTLTELKAQWVTKRAREGLERVSRDGLGVVFACPDGCGRVWSVMFSNPLDGKASLADDERDLKLAASGSDFATLSLSADLTFDKHLSLRIQGGEVSIQRG